MEIKKLSIAASMLHWAAYAALLSGSTATIFSLILAGAIWQQATEGTPTSSREWLIVAGLPVFAILFYGIAGGLGGLIHSFLYNHLKFLPRLLVTEIRVGLPTRIEETPDPDKKPFCIGFSRYLN